MKSLEDLEKKINSELTTKINNTEIKHNQIYIETDKEDIVDVAIFLKTHQDTKFRQLIDITVVDYPEQNQRFEVVYLFLSHEFKQRLIVKYSIAENEDGADHRHSSALHGQLQYLYGTFRLNRWWSWQFNHLAVD